MPDRVGQTNQIVLYRGPTPMPKDVYRGLATRCSENKTDLVYKIVDVISSSVVVCGNNDWLIINKLEYPWSYWIIHHLYWGIISWYINIDAVCLNFVIILCMLWLYNIIVIVFWQKWPLIQCQRCLLCTHIHLYTNISLKKRWIIHCHNGNSLLGDMTQDVNLLLVLRKIPSVLKQISLSFYSASPWIWHTVYMYQHTHM